MATPPTPGPHELGQNFLTDPDVIRAVVHLASARRGALVEWAAGNGALTRPLSALGRPLEAVEIDARRVARLNQLVVGPHVSITRGDILRHAPPARDYDLVCNVPFHITTRVMRRILQLPNWRRAILITQWEVARKRAGVGGATQLTAQWWPWFCFSLQRRIPAAAFTPRPSVDAGLLLIERRRRPLVDDMADFQHFVRSVFTGSGRGLAEILVRAGGMSPDAADAWCLAEGLTRRALPRELTADQWASVYRLRSRGFADRSYGPAPAPPPRRALAGSDGRPAWPPARRRGRSST